MNRILFAKLWSFTVGLMDACTGILLIISPAHTLRLMSVPPVHPEALVFLSWMGVFIAGVGMSYLLVLRGNREAETVWVFTGLVRSLVAIFLTVKIATGALPAAWAMVAATDAVVATGQFVLIRAGCWKGARS